jgi:hypothetical protein
MLCIYRVIFLANHTASNKMTEKRSNITQYSPFSSNFSTMFAMRLFSFPQEKAAATLKICLLN